jgi:uncharacterized membrane protein YqjE
MTDSEKSGANAGRGAGLLVSLPRLLATMIEILQTRVEIVANEFEEERERIRELVVFGFFVVFFVNLGLVLLTLFVVILLWDTHRVYAVGGFAVLYLGLGIMAGADVRRRLKARPRLFATTLAELSKDRDHLAPR